MTPRTDLITSDKITVVLAARVQFGRRFAYRLALNAGIPVDLVDAIFSRADGATRESFSGSPRFSE